MASRRRLTEDEIGQDEFDRRADAVDEALEGADVHEELAILTMFLARWLSRIQPESREVARKDMQEILDSEIRDWISANSDA